MQSSGRISCDKDATVQAQYIIQGEELMKGQEVFDFFYLVRFNAVVNCYNSSFINTLPGLVCFLCLCFLC